MDRYYIKTCVWCVIDIVYEVSDINNDDRYFVDDCFFFFQAEDGIRDLVRSRGLGDVYKRQEWFMGSFRQLSQIDSLHSCPILPWNVESSEEKALSLIHI